ncbi:MULTISPECIES: C40 family peptidase [Romboutsia]|uniref:Endopeptidase, NLPC/P60 domain n=2 Tax=Romboutsia TaxID=1501226 RepID=A0A2P2BPT5_9FIRM|nr:MULTISPECIES: C40 family peptidase [Romboutsia]MCH1959681.1 C40 family peptidase [Romboutsia hominis]MCH1969896.1 C40 family peptidase [Romboutsia hominis]MDB8792455.1 C40 family peptidase [Romboutsia sp. 1001216sp1]MDB8795750.1 C40 family peptidase [Romboutsia sp. 1001216sp1]MDB8798371.1 C40 family peptidase [Romboutsia sp. 1001216sp1]
MNVNQIVMIELLNAISKSNSKNKACTNNNSNVFDFVLQSTFNSILNDSPTCSCSCSCSNENQNKLNGLDTLLSNVNVSKVNNSSNINNAQKSNNKMDDAIKLLESQIGKPYVWGATGPKSFDCSGLVQYVYKNALGKDIPRVSYEQSKFGKAIDKKDLQVGDLIFFDTMNKGRVSHVGMYVGNGEFIHASNPKDGVKKSKLTGYYEKHYRGARRP